MQRLRQKLGNLKSFFHRRSIHNRVQMRRHLHELKIQKVAIVMDRFFKLDELCMSMQAIGAEVAQNERLVILIRSLSSDQIVRLSRTLGTLICSKPRRCFVVNKKAFIGRSRAKLGCKQQKTSRARISGQKKNEQVSGTFFICGEYKTSFYYG